MLCHTDIIKENMKHRVMKSITARRDLEHFKENTFVKTYVFQWPRELLKGFYGDTTTGES